MSRVAVHTLDSVSEAARSILEHVVDASPGTGKVLNLWGAMANAPVTLATYMGIRDVIDAHATLDPKIRTAIMLTTGSVIGGAYSQAINSRLAQRAGWTTEETLTIRAGTALEPRLDALLAVVQEATTDEGRVQDATWARAKAVGWSDPELVEAFTFVVLTIFVDYFAHFVDLELDVSPLAAAAIAAGTAA
jgi:alkylhydroperoxidase family enzyme